MGRMIPKILTGAPMPDISDSVRKKQPIGTPALPTAEMTEIRIQSRMVGIERAAPPFCITKSEVTRIKAAQPFKLIVVQIGSTKRDIFLRTPSRCSAVSIVTGSVAALLFVKSAISTAGTILLNTCIGFNPRASRKRGSTIKN